MSLQPLGESSALKGLSRRLPAPAQRLIEGTPTDEERRERLWLRAQPLLAEVESRTDFEVKTQIHDLRSFFADAKSGTPEFAEAVLAFGSKWRLVVDQIPFTKGDRHDQYLKERFAEHVFHPDELRQAVERPLAETLASMKSHESTLLVALRQDVEWPFAAAQEGDENQTVEALYADAIERASNVVGGRLRGDVAREVASLVAGEVLAQVAVRLGVSSGILAAGSTSGVATFGVGLAVGLIVDQIVSRVWDWWSDPQGELAQYVCERLDELEHSIIDGDSESMGLRDRMLTLVNERNAARREAIRRMILGDRTNFQGVE